MSDFLANHEQGNEGEELCGSLMSQKNAVVVPFGSMKHRHCGTQGGTLRDRGQVTPATGLFIENFRGLLAEADVDQHLRDPLVILQHARGKPASHDQAP